MNDSPVESPNESEGAWHDLGGLRGEDPSVESARAMLNANMGGARERAIVRRADTQAERDAYAERYLSGTVDRTPEEAEALQKMRTKQLADVAAKAIANGKDPILVAAQQRARDERRKRA